MSGRPAFDLSLYLVVGQADVGSRALEDLVAQAVAGGVTLVQLRDKTASEQRFVELARALMAVLRPRGIPLIVNDRVEAARAVGAAGLHLGQDDLAPSEARARIGPDKILGLTAGLPELARAAPLAEVDYLGVGPVHATVSKADHKPPIGAAGIAAVRAVTALPIVAIGGLTAARAPAVIEAGADGVAVVSAVCGAADSKAAARDLRRAIAAARRGGR
jgi:thiamine-phosphate pyrophosphorylase